MRNTRTSRARRRIEACAGLPSNSAVCQSLFDQPIDFSNLRFEISTEGRPLPRPRQLHDAYFKQAKAEGYLARSAYKLKDIQEKKSLIRPGYRVLDLGCAPGSWLQVAAQLAGPRGRVIGIDLQPIDMAAVRRELDHSTAETITAIQGDAYAIDPATLLDLAGGQFDAVLSDMAPNTSGHGDDHLSARLCHRVLELLPGLLRRGGNVCMKVLEGEAFPALLRETKRLFADAGATKPKSSRDVSREIFIVGTRYRG